MDLNGQTHIITGAAGAIGRVVAEVFIAAGARVVLVDRDEAAVMRVADELDAAAAFGVDLTDFQQAQTMAEEAVIRVGAVTGLINVAGGFKMVDLVDTTPDDYDHMLDINLRTLYNTTRAVLPLLVEQGHGFVAGFSAGPGFERGSGSIALYSAAKAGVSALLQGLADEVRPQGIGVSVVYPMGVVDTPANRKAMPDADPATWIDPRSIGDALVFAAHAALHRAVIELPIYPPQ